MRELLKKSLFLVGLVKAARQLPVDWKRLRWTSRRAAQVTAYLDTHKERKLQIGAGANFHEGWLNTDLFPRDDRFVYLDCTEPFPLPDASMDIIYSEHIFEHVWYPDGRFMLKECLRVLKPGGVMRLSTPNLRNIIRLLTDSDAEICRKYIELSSAKHIPHNEHRLPSFVVNNFFWDFGHYFVYDPETLRMCLEETGFTDVTEKPIGESTHAPLHGLERHGAVVGEAVNQFETMIFEGSKPE